MSSPQVNPSSLAGKCTFTSFSYSSSVTFFFVFVIRPPSFHNFVSKGNNAMKMLSAGIGNKGLPLHWSLSPTLFRPSICLRPLTGFQGRRGSSLRPAPPPAVRMDTWNIYECIPLLSHTLNGLQDVRTWSLYCQVLLAEMHFWET